MIYKFFFITLLALILPSMIYAAQMSSENYSVEAGRIGSGVIFIPGATSTSYEVDVSHGTQSEQITSTSACNDGVDNDSDGLTDYPNDPGCSSASDNDETNAISSGGGGGGAVATAAVSQPLITDPDGDGDFDIFDFNLLMINWTATNCGNEADIDSNCVVDIFDFNLLMINWSI